MMVKHSIHDSSGVSTLWKPGILAAIFVASPMSLASTEECGAFGKELELRRVIALAEALFVLINQQQLLHIFAPNRATFGLRRIDIQSKDILASPKKARSWFRVD